jgi:signal transduction histidine kinase
MTQTNSQLIVQTYIRTLFVTTLLSLLITVGVISGLLLKNGATETNKMVDSLQDTFVHTTPNTDAWQASSRQGPSTTYVKIKVHATKGLPASTFYATGTQHFTQLTSHNLSPVLKYVPHHGLFFYASRQTKKAGYQVWLNLNYILSELYVVLFGILLAAGLSALLGVFLIRMAARKITRPLTALTAEIQQRTDQLQDSNPQLTVPTTPLEVQQLATHFNQLLDALNQQIAQEKRFVSDASHELRTPLSVIRGYISLLKRRGADHPEVIQESLQFLDSESLRLQQLVEALLTLTRNQQLHLDLKPLALTDLFTDIATNYQPQITQTLAVDLSAPLSVTADKGSLKQILLALLDNAHKYAPANSIITLSAQQQQQQVLISVSDTGAGIPDSQKPHIFDRFYRVDSARSSDIPGTGLGLAIVKQLAELNHATIQVRDQQPTGSIFTLVFQSK